MLTYRRRDEEKMATRGRCKQRSVKSTLPRSYSRSYNPSLLCGHRQIEQGRFSNEITLVPPAIFPAEYGCGFLVRGLKGLL